ncbi:MAG: hypothetical protein IPN19_04640 [Elusimicrobia bacterium]|nr:hypothetical protein [Elusimicrobiota bacterium]
MKIFANTDRSTLYLLNDKMSRAAAAVGRFLNTSAQHQLIRPAGPGSLWGVTRFWSAPTWPP